MESGKAAGWQVRIGLAMCGLGRRVREVERIRKADDRELAANVLRLSELSPHLLRDIGFHGEDGGRVLTDGRHRIAVPGPEAPDRILRVGRV